MNWRVNTERGAGWGRIEGGLILPRVSDELGKRNRLKRNQQQPSFLTYMRSSRGPGNQPGFPGNHY